MSTLSVRAVLRGFVLLSTILSIKLLADAAPPVIRQLPDWRVLKGESAGPIPLTISIGQTSPDQLKFFAASSNPAVVPVDNIRFGFGHVTITPVPNQSGHTTISLTVVEPNGTSASMSFNFEVSTNSRPSISSIQNVTVPYGESLDDIIPFEVGDPETPPELLTLSVRSSNPRLIPDKNIQLGGTGQKRLLIVIPEQGEFGDAIITVNVSDSDGASASQSFLFRVLPLNQPPKISPISDQTIERFLAPVRVPFVVSDLETPPENLHVAVASSNTRLLPSENLFVSGTTTNRMLLLIPVPNQTGETIITIRVTDAAGFYSEQAFKLIVLAGTSNPFISNISDASPFVSTCSDATIGPFLFTVFDSRFSPESLVVTVASSNPHLIPQEGIQISGEGTNRTVTLRPTANLAGSALITLSAQNGLGEVVSSSFRVSLSHAGRPPLISSPTLGIVIDQDTKAGPIAISTVVETPPIITSSNPQLVPPEGMILRGGSHSYALEIAPAPGQSGTAQITLKAVAANGDQDCTSFLLTVRPCEAPPAISFISDQVTDEDTVAGPILFTIKSCNSPVDVVRIGSSDPTLVSEDDVFITRSGPEQSMIILPRKNRAGTVTLALHAADANGLSTARTFKLTVQPVNDPPEISPIPDLVTSVNQETDIVSFTIHDDETAADELTLTASSSNPDLVRPENVQFRRMGSHCELIIIPERNRFGRASIAVTVTDAAGASTGSKFNFVVQRPQCNPIISSVPDQQVFASEPPKEIRFLAGSDTGCDDVTTVSAQSSNPSLFPNENLFISSVGLEHWLRVVPVTNQPGKTTITLFVTTVEGGRMSTSFQYVVLPPPKAPVLALQHDPSRTLIELHGPDGRYAIETSSDLVNWQVIGAVTNAAGMAAFEDRTLRSPSRFFRARVAP